MSRSSRLHSKASVEEVIGGTLLTNTRQPQRNKFQQEHSVANNKNPNLKQPGEKEPGTFHYNPGNMSGKTIGTGKDKSEKQSEADRTRSSTEQPDKKAVNN